MGQVASGLSLRELKNPKDISKLNISQHHFRGDWLTGFGWNDSHWSSAPTRELLDQYFPDFPVSFSRVDGHAAWINSQALARIENKVRDQVSARKGIVVDQDKMQIDYQLPYFTEAQIEIALLRAQDMLREQHITHIRDMTCTETQWRVARKLEDSGRLKLWVEEVFVVENLEEVRARITFILKVRSESSVRLRAQGIKIFLDGALGSEGAFLSQNYQGSNSRGELAWSYSDLLMVMNMALEAGVDLAIHTIGDAAVDFALDAALESLTDFVRVISVKGDTAQAIRSIIHFEHVELCQKSSIEKMKKLKQLGLPVICHMQPCHWLSDHEWLSKKLGPLAENAFRWREIEEAGISIFFGSDAPIEPANVIRNHEALISAEKKGILPPRADWTSFHSHPDLTFGAHEVSEFKNSI